MGKRLFSVRSVPRLYHPHFNYNAGVFVERVFVTERHRLVVAEESYLLGFKE
jgi:hypothetical protein